MNRLSGASGSVATELVYVVERNGAGDDRPAASLPGRAQKHRHAVVHHVRLDHHGLRFLGALGAGHRDESIKQRASSFNADVRRCDEERGHALGGGFERLEDPRQLVIYVWVAGIQPGATMLRVGIKARLSRLAPTDNMVVTQEPSFIVGRVALVLHVPERRTRRWRCRVDRAGASQADRRRLREARD